MGKKGTGLSREPRIRAKQTAALENYAEQFGTIGGDPERDRQAQIVAVEKAGYTRATTDSAKVKQFQKLWKADESRLYLAELWGLAITQDPDPVSLAFRMLHEHMVQDDASWGERERGVSLSAARETLRMFVPAQTTKVLTAHLTAKVERPAEFDQEPEMKPRTILPAGQVITQPTGPTGAEDDDDEDDDDDDE